MFLQKYEYATLMFNKHLFLLSMLKTVAYFCFVETAIYFYSGTLL